MCGVFGVYFFDSSRPVSASMLKDCTDSMAHRGPDDSGYFVHKNVGLGHRRLSIIDLSSGHQPMANEDGQVVLVYNGEIYNYKEIRRELVARGHTFRTNCDTEVIVHGYEEWGTQCVDRFNGMFAFVLWDNHKKRLWAVRDRLGIKPLYYYIDNDVFICASEIKPILRTGIVRSELNENVLDAYFSVGYVPGPETMFKGIKKLLPGHFLVVHGSDVREDEYWDFSDVRPLDISFDEAVEQVEVLLVDSVQKRLMSDVPLGVFLSGGLDSSTVVSLMSKAATNGPIDTFTVSYREAYSEEKYAHAVAEKFQTNHNVFYLEAEEFFSSLKTLVNYAEEPIVEPAAIALYHLAKLAREKATVLLSGEGSDEIFAGYYLYQLMSTIEKYRKFPPDFIFPVIRALNNYLSKDKYRKYADWLTLPLALRYQGTSSYLTPSLKRRYYSPGFFGLRSTYLENQFAGYFERVQHKDPLAQMLYVDTKTWLVDDLLVKADKMTMAASVELRVPFLDYRLIETVTALPAKYKIRNGQGKFLLKKIMEPFLPHEIVYREKMGFPVPTKSWFQGDLMLEIQQIIMGLKKDPWFNSNVLDDLIFRHKAGVEDNSKILMTLLVFAEWQRQYA